MIADVVSFHFCFLLEKIVVPLLIMFQYHSVDFCEFCVMSEICPYII